MNTSQILMLLKMVKDGVDILKQHQIDVSLAGIDDAIKNEEDRHNELMEKLKELQ